MFFGHHSSFFVESFLSYSKFTYQFIICKLQHLLSFVQKQFYQGYGLKLKMNCTQSKKYHKRCSLYSQHLPFALALGSGPRYMICVTLFCTLRESENTWTCENRKRFACDSRKVQNSATKSDTSGLCLLSIINFVIIPNDQSCIFNIFSIVPNRKHINYYFVFKF